MDGSLLAAGIIDDILRGLGVNLRVLAVQAFIFIVTFFVLKKLLFERVIGHMKAREELVRRETERIQHERAELERLQKDHEAQVARIEKEAYDRLQAMMKQTLDMRAKIVAEAQRQAADELKRALDAIGQEKKNALSTLRNDVAVLSRQAVERVLDVPVEAAVLDEAVRKSIVQRMS